MGLILFGVFFFVMAIPGLFGGPFEVNMGDSIHSQTGTFVGWPAVIQAIPSLIFGGIFVGAGLAPVKAFGKGWSKPWLERLWSNANPDA